MQITNNSNEMLLDKVVEHIFAIRRITRQDQHILMTTFLSKEGLNEQDRLQISRVFDALKRGLIKVVD